MRLYLIFLMLPGKASGTPHELAQNEVELQAEQEVSVELYLAL